MSLRPYFDKIESDAEPGGDDEKSVDGPAKGTQEKPAEKPAGESAPKTPDEEPATVEIWHWKDVYVMPWQKVHARQDRQRNMLSAWHLVEGKFVQLGRDPIHESVTPIRFSKLAYAAEFLIRVI